MLVTLDRKTGKVLSVEPKPDDEENFERACERFSRDLASAFLKVRKQKGNAIVLSMALLGLLQVG